MTKLAQDTAALGTKRICPNCSARYYDLGANPPTCPKCDTKFDLDAFLKSRRIKTTAPVAAPKKEAKVKDTPEDDDDIDDEDAEAALAEAGDLDIDTDDDDGDTPIEDASELGDDDDIGVEMDDDDKDN